MSGRSGRKSRAHRTDIRRIDWLHSRYNFDAWAGCQGRLIVAPLWVAYRENLGTLMRTCDAAGACLAVPDTPHYRLALDKGDTLHMLRPCVHWVEPSKEAWLAAQRDKGWRIYAVELDQYAVSLEHLPKATERTVLLLGNEGAGILNHIIADADLCVQIPMYGAGRSLNVAVAGSLVLYKLAGLT